MGNHQPYTPPPPDREFKATRRREQLAKRIAERMINTYGTPFPDQNILLSEPALSRPGEINFYYEYVQRIYDPQTGQFRPDLEQRLHYNNQNPIGQPQIQNQNPVNFNQQTQPIHSNYNSYPQINQPNPGPYGQPELQFHPPQQQQAQPYSYNNNNNYNYNQNLAPNPFGN